MSQPTPLIRSALLALALFAVSATPALSAPGRNNAYTRCMKGCADKAQECPKPMKKKEKLCKQERDRCEALCPRQ